MTAFSIYWATRGEEPGRDLLLWIGGGTALLLHFGAAMTAIDAGMNGRSISVKIAYSRSWAALPRVLAAMIVRGSLVLAWLSAIFLLIERGSLGDDAEPLLWIVGIGAFVLFGIRMAVVDPAVVLDGLGPFAAMRRSYQLVRGNGVRCLLVLIVASLVFSLGSGFVNAISYASVQTFEESLAAILVVLLLLVAVQAVFYSLYSAWVTVFFADLKARKDWHDSPNMRG